MERFIEFANTSSFRRELIARVDAYFIEHGKKKRDNISLYIKALIILAWTGASYYLLVFKADSVLEALLLSLSLGLALAGIGFNIQHDGNHSGFSKKSWVNRIAGSTTDYFLGASSFIWKQKHNIRHHPFTNIPEGDSDIYSSFLMRVTPDQKHYKIHRYQNFYLWILYCLVHLRYVYSDFQQLISGTISKWKMPRPKGWELATFIMGKFVFFSFTLVIPSFLHPIWQVLLVYLLVSAIISLIFIVITQLAHMGSEVEHLDVTKVIPNEWAVHQLQTTADFAQDNKVLTWYVGGLNYQVEHHLFTDVSHVHYPALAKIIKEVSEEFGVRYTVHKSFIDALRSHYRFLRDMGRQGLRV